MDEPTADELGLQSPIAKQVYGLSRKVRELQATADRLRGLLKEIEYCVYDDEIGKYCCPVCGFSQHSSNCRLAKELETEAQKQADEYIESEGAHHSPDDFDNSNQDSE